jgi:hypothetical protein
MRNQKTSFDRAWRYPKRVLLIAAVSLTVWAAGPKDAEHSSRTQSAVTGLSIQEPDVMQAASAPSIAFARYIASLGCATHPANREAVTIEIEASLPRLGKQARFEAIRRTDRSGSSNYQVLHIEGDSIVKQQVIARYLTAEREAEAMPRASIAVSPANYEFLYVGSIATPSRFVYVYQVTPRKKRPGLIKGQLWIDAETGLALHEGGHLVKKPSIFVRHVELVRDIQLREGVPYLENTRLAVDTRLVGRAELTIREWPYSDSRQMATLNSTFRSRNCLALR